MANDVLSDLAESLRSGLLFGSTDEPLDDYGKRIVRVILAAVQAQPVSARPGVELCPACGKVANDVFGVCSHGFHAPKPTVCPVPCADGQLRPCHAYCQRCGDEIERASVSPLRDETREPGVVGYREVVVRLMDADNDPLLVHGPFPECQIGHPHKGSECPVWTLPPLTREPDTAGRVEPMREAIRRIEYDRKLVATRAEKRKETAEQQAWSRGYDRAMGDALAALQRARESAQGKTR
jgi:hypothetical protein